ncbi:hypothetical protein NQ176_g4582 [Zarea fungicola]|uniref:Uncharacterized protein n=1 Tax=Zarea fungicola TaxID=93591 RepID=A0ACC1NDX0_9HYPO|nr:hypothetical protein NQ176_g4582 [Lecanicillium fungicola]
MNTGSGKMQEPDFTIYEDPDTVAEHIRPGAPNAEGWVDEIATDLAVAINSIRLDDKMPIAWVASRKPPVLVSRNTKTHSFAIRTGPMSCQCYFVPGSNDIIVKNDSQVPIRAQNSEQCYKLPFKHDEQQLSPGTWQLAVGEETPSVAIRILAMDLLRDAADVKDIEQSNKRRRMDVNSAVLCRDACESGQSSLSQREKHPRQVSVGISVGGIQYRYQRDKTHGKLVRISFFASNEKFTSRRAQMWECCKSTLSKLDHPHITKLLDSDARDLSLKIPASFPVLLTGTDEQGYYQHVGEVDSFICQITSALVYLHSQELTHHDLGAGSILWQQPGKYVLSGFVRSGGTKPAYEVTTEQTPWYLAPEFYQEQVRDQKGDVFALAILVLYAKRYIPLPDSCQWWDAYGVQQGTEDVGSYLAWGDILNDALANLDAHGESDGESIRSALAPHEQRPTAVEFYESWLKQTNGSSTGAEERLQNEAV